jgi:RHS repeat-associated protein
VFFYSTDHLGSTVLVANHLGQDVWRGDTSPFGDSVSGSGELSDSERLKYTGKDYDEDIGLYHFNARWYDAETARFISEDPARDGVSWFAYVGNNPLRYIDPTGLRRVDGDSADSNQDRQQRRADRETRRREREERRQARQAERSRRRRTVDSGDTVSGMAAIALNDRDIAYTNGDLYDYVEQILEENGIEDPRNIKPGDELNFNYPDFLPRTNEPSLEMNQSAEEMIIDDFYETADRESLGADLLNDAVGLNAILNSSNPAGGMVKGTVGIAGASTTGGLSLLLAYDGLIETVGNFAEILDANVNGRPVKLEAGINGIEDILVPVISPAIQNPQNVDLIETVIDTGVDYLNLVNN